MNGIQTIFPAKNQCVMEVFDVPQKLEGNEILTQTLTSLISAGTEVSIYNGSHTTHQRPEITWGKYPFRPGYAACGKVIAVGPEVKSLKVGDHVLTRAPHTSHYVTSEDAVYACPKGISPEEVPLAVLAAISMNGIRHSDIALGTITVIVGQGLLGLFALQLAKMGGAYPVIAADISEKRLELSKQFGADEIIHSGKNNIVEAITAATKGKMADRVVEVTGLARLIPDCLKLLRKGGMLYLLGGAHGNVEIDFYSELVRKNLSIVGGHEAGAAMVEDYHFPWTVSANIRHCLELIALKKLDVGPLISNRISPNEVPKYYGLLSERAGDYLGVLIDWTKL
ncbi:MAG: zinc-binding alcohol dehydrogenase [Chthoniobacterales bacterium]